MPHPQLLLPIIGAALGMALVVYAAIWLVQRWKTLKPRTRWIAFTAIALFEAAYWLNVYAWFIEPRSLVVRQVEVVSEHWRGAPITIAAIGDTHVGGPHVDSARMLRVVRRINELRPDLVVLLGDYVAGHDTQDERSPAGNQDILGGIGTFAALTARYGVVAVIGNHDSWYNRQAVTTALQDAGVAALWNRNIVIRRSGGPVVIAGLEDVWTGHPDYEAAIDGAPANTDTIVIAHNPDAFTDAPAGAALYLGAHAHCGQVTIPLIGRPILPLRNRTYGCHRVEMDGKTIYVTAGIGTSGPPVRFLNPPEIVLITIRPARPQAPAPSLQPNSDN